MGSRQKRVNCVSAQISAKCRGSCTVTGHLRAPSIHMCITQWICTVWEKMPLVLIMNVFESQNMCECVCATLHTCICISCWLVKVHHRKRCLGVIRTGWVWLPWWEEIDTETQLLCVYLCVRVCQCIYYNVWNTSDITHQIQSHSIKLSSQCK